MPPHGISSLPRGMVPFALGFRPFFLGAGVYAVLLMGLWLLRLRGAIAPTDMAPSLWHGHEMLFGFTVAVIAGFLLTAAQNWTGIRTPSGTPLAALFVLWLAARIGFLLPVMPPMLLAVVDLAFLPALALTLAWPIMRAKQLHNYPFPLMLLAFAAANALVHGESLGWTSDTARLGLRLAAYVVVTMIVLMGGRVIPSFTDNKLGTRARRWNAVEKAVPLVTLGALIATLAFPASIVTALLAAIAAAVHATRLAGWYTRKFWSVPLLSVLHLGYAWIVLGFALLALSAAGYGAAESSALHAFTAGGIGGLTLGMMSRVALGHTGRMLEPAPVISLAFAVANLAAFVRVFLPLVAPDALPSAYAISGILWMLAFGTFATIYLPILMRPRVDGRQG